MTPSTKRHARLLEVLGWLLLSFVAAGATRLLRPQPLYNDSYQYLSVAENLREGRGAVTSLVHFDTERSHGRIPAPLTSFPPGYPLVVASVAGSTSDLETAARIISEVSYAATAALLAWALFVMNVPALMRRLVLVLFTTNAVALGYATSVMTEPLFMLLSTGAVAALLWSERGRAAARVLFTRAAVAYTLAALTCWVRYAGFFLIGGMAGHALLRWLRQRTRTCATLLLLALIPVASAGTIMLRNLLSVGTWRGGSELPVSHPLKGVAAEFVRAHLHLFFGEHPHTIGGWEALVLPGGLILAAMLLPSFKGRAPDAEPRLSSIAENAGGAWLALVLCLIFYVAGVFYAGLFTVVSFGTRMFVPVLPLYLLLSGVCLARATSRRLCGAQGVWVKAGLALVLTGYVGSNARALSERPAPARHELLSREYDAPTATGQPLREWVELNIPPGAVIMAADGQATGHLLRRPTLSMVEAHYSRVRWECEEVRRQMSVYGVRYLILYKPSAVSDADALASESAFVAAAVSQPQPPCGFVVAAENAGVRVLETGAASATEQR